MRLEPLSPRARLSTHARAVVMMVGEVRGAISLFRLTVRPAHAPTRDLSPPPPRWRLRGPQPSSASRAALRGAGRRRGARPTAHLPAPAQCGSARRSGGGRCQSVRGARRRVHGAAVRSRPGPAPAPAPPRAAPAMADPAPARSLDDIDLSALRVRGAKGKGPRRHIRTGGGGRERDVWTGLQGPPCQDRAAGSHQSHGRHRGKKDHGGGHPDVSPWNFTCLELQLLPPPHPWGCPVFPPRPSPWPAGRSVGWLDSAAWPCGPQLGTVLGPEGICPLLPRAGRALLGQTRLLLSSAPCSRAPGAPLPPGALTPASLCQPAQLGSALRPPSSLASLLCTGHPRAGPG
nr:translation initiation factor IF-2-like isoform X1 [Chrysemys picta bellii]